MESAVGCSLVEVHIEVSEEERVQVWEALEGLFQVREVLEAVGRKVGSNDGGSLGARYEEGTDDIGTVEYGGFKGPVGGLGFPHKSHTTLVAGGGLGGIDGVA